MKDKVPSSYIGVRAASSTVRSHGLLDSAFLAGIVVYGIVVLRISDAQRRDRRFWSYLASLLLFTSFAILGAYLIPASLGLDDNTSTFVILETPLQRTSRYWAPYAASYLGLSLGVLSAMHRW